MVCCTMEGVLYMADTEYMIGHKVVLGICFDWEAIYFHIKKCWRCAGISRNSATANLATSWPGAEPMHRTSNSLQLILTAASRPLIYLHYSGNSHESGELPKKFF